MPCRDKPQRENQGHGIEGKTQGRHKARWTKTPQHHGCKSIEGYVGKQVQRDSKGLCRHDQGIEEGSQQPHQGPFTGLRVLGIRLIIQGMLSFHIKPFPCIDPLRLAASRLSRYCPGRTFGTCPGLGTKPHILLLPSFDLLAAPWKGMEKAFGNIAVDVKACHDRTCRP